MSERAWTLWRISPSILWRIRPKLVANPLLENRAQQKFVTDFSAQLCDGFFVTGYSANFATDFIARFFCLQVMASVWWEQVFFCDSLMYSKIMSDLMVGSLLVGNASQAYFCGFWICLSKCVVSLWPEMKFTSPREPVIILDVGRSAARKKGMWTHMAGRVAWLEGPPMSVGLTFQFEHFFWFLMWSDSCLNRRLLAAPASFEESWSFWVPGPWADETKVRWWWQEWLQEGQLPGGNFFCARWEPLHRANRAGVLCLNVVLKLSFWCVLWF